MLTLSCDLRHNNKHNNIKDMSNRLINLSVNILMLIKCAHFVVLLKKQLPFYCDCTTINTFCVDLSFYITNFTKITHSLILKDIIFYYKNPKSLSFEHIINYFILATAKQEVSSGQCHSDTLWSVCNICSNALQINFVTKSAYN